jgi:hypothetical protein
MKILYIIATAFLFSSCGVIEGFRQFNYNAPSSGPSHVNKPHGSVWDGPSPTMRNNYNEEGE